MPENLTPSARRFLEAVARGEAVQLRRNNPYRTVVKGTDLAVPKTVLRAVYALVAIDFESGDTWERPYMLTEAGRVALETNA